MEWCPECNGEMVHSGGTEWKCPFCDEYFYVCPHCGDTVDLDFWNVEENVCCDCEDSGHDDDFIVFTFEEDILLERFFGEIVKIDDSEKEEDE